MMYKTMEYADADSTIIHAINDDDGLVIIEHTNKELWRAASTGALGKVKAYTPPPEPTAKQKLATERAAMKCSTAQLGLALIEMGLIDDIEAAFAVNAKAGMIWRKATHVKRGGPILESLKTKMTEKQIDELFKEAMATPV